MEAYMARPITQKQVRLPLIDNPTAPNLFADEAVGFFVVNNTMRITFAAARVDHTTNPGTQSRVVTGRLVMPIAAAENLHSLLSTLLENVKSRQAVDVGAHTLQ
jgi:hypothetical protein